MARIVHIIPYDGIGGVELAARSLPAGPHGDLEVHKVFVAARGPARPGPFVHVGAHASENDPRNHARALRMLLRLRPDLLVVSLWRSCPAALLGAMRPGVRLVPFLHLPHTTHVLDRGLNGLAMRHAHEIWTDSEATRMARVPARLQERSRVISFLLERRPLPPAADPAPHFLFWGRLNWQKGLERAFDVFARIHAVHPGARYTVIGPDGGEAAALRAAAAQRGLTEAIRFKGPLEQSEIFALARQGAFFLQASKTEGMAMSVVEAMQAGLVPVVTSVGEIAHYARDGVNAVLFDEPGEAARRVLDLTGDPARYRAISRAAAETWTERPLYRDSFLAACRGALERAA